MAAVPKPVKGHKSSTSDSSASQAPPSLEAYIYRFEQAKAAAGEALCK